MRGFIRFIHIHNHKRGKSQRNYSKRKIFGYEIHSLHKRRRDNFYSELEHRRNKYVCNRKTKTHKDEQVDLQSKVKGFNDDDFDDNNAAKLGHSCRRLISNPTKKQKRKTLVHVPSLPWEIISNILCCLPVKDVLCCRSVSKSWCSIIDDPYFVKMHLKNSMDTFSKRGIIPTSPSSYCKWVDHSPDIYPPIGFDYQFNYFDIVGSCNGLLAIVNREKGKDREIALWNPFTRRYRTLPKLEIDFKLKKCYSNDIYGFGYDPISDDYKFVRITFIYKTSIDELFCCQVHICSLKTKSWRRVNELPYKGRDKYKVRFSNGILINYTLHWLLNGEKWDGPKLIMGFDLVSEKFHEVPQPNYEMDIEFDVEMGTVGGKYLYLCCCSKNRLLWRVRQDDCIFNWEMNIWLMKLEYDGNINGSWIKLICLPYVYSDDVKPTIAYWKNANHFFFNCHETNKLYSYNLETESFAFAHTSKLRPLCVESLVGLGDGDWENITDRKKRSECHVMVDPCSYIASWQFG